MARALTTENHTFAHADAADADLFDVSTKVRSEEASSAPARPMRAVHSLDRNARATDTQKYTARACGGPSQRSLEESSLQPHGDMPMQVHGNPSPFDQDEPIDHLWGRSVVQPAYDVMNTPSAWTKAGSFPTFVRHDQTCGNQRLNENYRNSQGRNVSCLSTSPMSPYQRAQPTCFSTSSIPRHEEQVDSWSQSSVRNFQATVSFDSKRDETRVAENRTTVMLMNVPLGYTNSKLMGTLDAEGFAGMYDFIYVPVKFKSHSSLGYAFVNLTHPSIAQRFRAAFDGFSGWSTRSKSVCHAVWATKHQGLRANVDYYRNRTVMSDSVPHEYKPWLFMNGMEIPFLPPDRAPRVLKSARRTNGSEKSKRHD